MDGGVSITEQTSWRLEEAYATLTLMENNIFRVPDTNDSLRESFHLLLGYMQSLHSDITDISSYENAATDDSALSFSTQYTGVCRKLRISKTKTSDPLVSRKLSPLRITKTLPPKPFDVADGAFKLIRTR